MAMATLFGFAGWKRKTTETTGEEIAAAEAEKGRQKDAQVADLQKAASDLRAAMAANAPTFAVPTQPGKKKPSMNPDAVRKRAERKRASKYEEAEAPGGASARIRWLFILAGSPHYSGRSGGRDSLH